jgi:hypothetical protein
VALSSSVRKTRREKTEGIPGVREGASEVKGAGEREIVGARAKAMLTVGARSKTSSPASPAE